MAPQFIPSGRTSVVKKGKSEFQLQTEYAGSPQPRITTTIFSEGRVLHKIEKAIEKQITSVEEMHLVEDIIKSQHHEISKIIRERGLPTVPKSQVGLPREKTRSQRIREMLEVDYVFRITPEGKIAEDGQITGDFKRLFKHVIKELPRLMAVFAALPHDPNQREEGIYEIERGRILFASTGLEFYLILIRPGTEYDAVAGRLKEILGIK